MGRESKYSSKLKNSLLSSFLIYTPKTSKCKNITWRYGYHLLAMLARERSFQHSNIKSASPRARVISSTLLYCF
ncbi:uncharacterized protein LOC110251280 [Exaiptasia diaphana]|uniref:Uncharacterized protein n=1 Tax=Exaiptasia diaphana TaxID=2652724 RepID=A0A913YT49_EXADI|nr:uncharacterized protein LOC110251280 [Exaiptasia diaphana]